MGGPNFDYAPATFAILAKVAAITVIADRHLLTFCGWTEYCAGQIIMDRCRSDGALAHRNGYLIKSVRDVSDGVCPFDAGSLLCIDDNATAFSEPNAKPRREIRLRNRAQGDIKRVKVRGFSVLQRGDDVRAR